MDGLAWTTSETFDDGRALFTAVCELGLEGFVAKNHSRLYRPRDRGWVKVKNLNYWRRDAERGPCNARLDAAFTSSGAAGPAASMKANDQSQRTLE
ncbi:MAG: hypothetical protein M3364_06030 [Actinomycetota bacterium]|nr:hypothetical protein [Actinomycetota bacterium]